MRIEIDTKEDLHNLRHVIQFLSAIQSNPGKNKHYDDSSYSSSSSSSSVMSMFGDPSPQTTPATTASTFNMFDTPVSSTPSSTPAASESFMSLFSPEPKKEDDGKDFLDSMQVY